MRWPHVLPLLIAAACAGTGTEGSRSAALIGVKSRVYSSGPRAVPAPPAADSSGSDTATVKFDAAEHPVLPVVLRDYCEGEDCGTHFDAVACIPTGLRDAPSDGAPITIPLAAGDSARVVRRDLRVLSPGVVVVMQDFVLDQEEVEVAGGVAKAPRTDTVRIARGDTLYLISYLAMGRWRWALHTRLHDSDEFWAAAPEGGLGGAGDDSTHAAARSMPETEDWWLVETRSAKAGWWQGDGHSELQPISDMQHWSDDCDQVRARSLGAAHGAPERQVPTGLRPAG
jgi:hypothetical protein